MNEKSTRPLVQPPAAETAFALSGFPRLISARKVLSERLMASC